MSSGSRTSSSSKRRHRDRDRDHHDRGDSSRSRSRDPRRDNEKRPRIQIKTEKELNDSYFGFDDDDIPSGPPTPPLIPDNPPNSGLLDENLLGRPQTASPPSSRPVQNIDIINCDVDVEVDTPAYSSPEDISSRDRPREPEPGPSPSASSSSRKPSHSSSRPHPRTDHSRRSRTHSRSHSRSPQVVPSGRRPEVQRTEPNPTSSKVTPPRGPRGDFGDRTNKNCGKPSSSLSDFFSFSDPDKIQPGLPNSMTASIRSKCKPVVRPPKAHYHSRAADEELNYVKEGVGKISSLPVFHNEPTKQGSDAESDDTSEDEHDNGPLHPNGEKLARYYEHDSVYKKYDFDRRSVDPTGFAVYEKKHHILNTLENNRVLIVEGFTGCGKTTQIPQFLLDRCRRDKSFCNIAVTQPRKIAAISVARRVCSERKWELGSVVGFQVGMESKLDKDSTLLTFMTTGVLLQKLISQKSLKDFSHIIIDEVHERDLESDFLLLVIKRLMARDREGKESHVKVILMSATIDTAKFEKYFQFMDASGDVKGPPVIKIPFLGRFRVDEYYLEDLISSKQMEIIESNMDKGKAAIQEDIYKIAVACIAGLDNTEKDTNPDPRKRGKEQGLFLKESQRGAVLVFLPGMEEIKTLRKKLDDYRRKHSPTKVDNFKWAVYLLHSSVTAENQRNVFKPSEPYFRKIILSTNIAESSVTVPDVKYVIDFCLTKSLCIDEETNFTTLRMIWASKSQCVQRRGRTGRVANGKVYRLVPTNFYHALDKDIVPEMRRSNLETVILRCKKFDVDTPGDLLRDALDPPDLSKMERAVSTLKELGALTIMKKDQDAVKYDTCDGDLTFLGNVMAALPIPQQCTRLILFGHCFGVMREAIVIAAGLSVKSPFETGSQNLLDKYLQKMTHARGSFSDPFALYYVYEFWVRNYCEIGGTKKENEYRWAYGANVQLSKLREIKSTVELLEGRLNMLGIKNSYTLPSESKTDPTELSPQQGMFLKLAIAGAFYPNYFLRRRPDPTQFERDMNKKLNGNDPLQTVYFEGFPSGHNASLYAKTISSHLGYGLNIPSIRYEGRKVFALFDNTVGATIGPFSVGMFRALKQRQFGSEMLKFNVLSAENEGRAVQRWNDQLKTRKCVPCPPLYTLPPLHVANVEVKVQHILSPSQFWVIVKDAYADIDHVSRTIKKYFVMSPLPASKLSPNCLCLAQFEGIYYRAKVLRTGNAGDRTQQSLVYFVDFGNSTWVPTSKLSDFTPDLVTRHLTNIKCLAIECRLGSLKPNGVLGSHWSQDAIKKLRLFSTKAPKLSFNIFSIYQSKMVGELLAHEEGKPELSLNHFLISPDKTNKICAEVAPEPYLSLENHRRRERVHTMGQREKIAAANEQTGEPLDWDFMDMPRDGAWPRSPLEMEFEAQVRCCSSTKTARVIIDSGSVNSVLLDHEPTASNSRMLVASHVGVKEGPEKSKTLRIHESTVMSPIPGILQLVTMIFAPRIELRVDRHCSKYVGLLCGCGTIPNTATVSGDNKNSEVDRVVHSDNDKEIVFDTEIDDKDVTQVNFIRYYLNNILTDNRNANKSEHHKRLREDIIKLLRRRRKKLEEQVWPQEEYVWNRISQDLIEDEVSPGMIFSHDDIFRPHAKVKLNTEEEEEVVWDLGY